MCAVAYVLQLDELRDHVRTAQLIAGAHRAAGNDVPMPDWGEARAAWEAELCEPPRELTADPQVLQLKKALGLKP